MANKIMTNEEVIKATQEITSEKSGNGFKMAKVISLTVLVGMVTYKYIVEPIIVKLKPKKRNLLDELEEFNDREFVTEIEEN